MSPGSSDRRVRKCVRMRSQENSKKRQNAEMGWFAENLSKCSETSRVRSGVIGFREGLRGRDAGIRTRDPLNPIQVRYQTAPRPDRKGAFEQGNGGKLNDPLRLGGTTRAARCFARAVAIAAFRLRWRAVAASAEALARRDLGMTEEG